MSDFVQKCLQGEAFADEIDNYVDQWHEMQDENPTTLREFLGMTKEEYVRWVMNPAELIDILSTRAYKINQSIFVTA